MKYPVFVYGDRSYTFIPPKKNVTDNLVNQLVEVAKFYAKTPLYAYIGFDRCVILGTTPLDDFSEEDILPVLPYVPEKYNKIEFTSVDDSECEIALNKPVSPAFKRKMEGVLLAIIIGDAINYGYVDITAPPIPISSDSEE